MTGCGSWPQSTLQDRGRAAALTGTDRGRRNGAESVEHAEDSEQRRLERLGKTQLSPLPSPQHPITPSSDIPAENTASEPCPEAEGLPQDSSFVNANMLTVEDSPSRHFREESIHSFSQRRECLGRSGMKAQAPWGPSIHQTVWL